MSNLQIPIVVVAFDRPHSLSRILTSLDRCRYPAQVRLIISIDGGGVKEVTELATQFHWKHGEKEIIYHDDNLGLRAHILKCGQLALKYDGIVLLEDDLYVSPYFYQFMLAAQGQYKHDKNISGIALYSPVYCETACLPFTPIADGYDVFFMQLACSWGQSWLSRQWQDFETWYATNKDLVLQDDISLPPDVKLWPDSSWKKYFIKYNIENNKFFVYPRSSFTTNFADAGVNHTQTKLWQVPISFGKNGSGLPEFDESVAKYDAFYELLPESLKKLAGKLDEYDFTVDLYGVRDKEAILTEYVISRNEFSDHLLSFGCEIKPHEANIIDNFPGEHFKLGKTENMLKHVTFLGHRYRIFADYRKTQRYFYAITPEHLVEYGKDTCAAQEKEKVLNSQENNSALMVQNSNELLADIEYINAAVSEEMTGLRNHFSSLLKAQPAREIKLNLVVNEFSEMLAHLATKIHIVEQVITNNKEIELSLTSAGKYTPVQSDLTYLPEIKITASELAKYDKMESLEQAENGIQYCWTSADKNIEFALPVQRDETMELIISIYSLIKSKFGKSMRVYIDGKHIKHSFRQHEDLYIVTCRLPSMKNSRETQIKISLPGTYSPRELGLSDDQRKLGIAINEIRFSKADRRIGHWRRRLKLKA